MAKIKGLKKRTVRYTQEYTLELTPELIEFFNKTFGVNYSEKEIIELINHGMLFKVTTDELDMLNLLVEQLYSGAGKCSEEECDSEQVGYYEIELEI